MPMPMPKQDDKIEPAPVPKKEDKIDPAVGVILEAKIGDKVEAGAVLCRLYYTKEEGVDEAAELMINLFWRGLKGTRSDKDAPGKEAPVVVSN